MNVDSVNELERSAECDCYGLVCVYIYIISNNFSPALK
jgi:hypothetical protein